MYVRRVGDGIAVSTPAKLNLFLEVLARRDDGYHEIETLMTAISVFDTLSFFHNPTSPKLSSPRIELECRGAYGLSPKAWGELPEGEENLAVRAVRRLSEVAGQKNASAKILLVKRIPTAAGLGGASSDAAAALVAASLAWRLHWPMEQLREVSSEIGSDVPFFLDQMAPGPSMSWASRGLSAGRIRPAICRGRGERIERLDGVPRFHVVVIKPDGGLSAAEVYRRCRPSSAPHAAAPLLAALRQGRLDSAAKWMTNRLQAPAGELSPEVIHVRREFQRLGVGANMMSGSGTSVFGLFRTARAARKAAAQLRGRNLGAIYCATSL